MFPERSPWSEIPIRAALLLMLLAMEVTHLGFPLLRYLNPAILKWSGEIVADGRPLGEAVICGVLVAIFLSWPSFRPAFKSALREIDSPWRNFWLEIHLACLVTCAIWLVCGMRSGDLTANSISLWFLCGAVVLPAVAFTWSAAIFGSSFWRHWFASNPALIFVGFIGGALTRFGGYFAQMLWPTLRQPTFETVGVLLHSLGFQVISDPSQALLGTTRFLVRIGPTCSGLEGIALISVFLASYLWLYRAEYRFPAALVLIPVAITLSWTLNAVRIAALILIGNQFSEFAVKGFHTVAGWVLLNATAFSILAASRYFPWICRREKSALLAPSPQIVHSPL